MVRPAMQQLRRFAKGDLIVKTEEDHKTVFRLLSGAAARIRTLEDGRRQIIAIFLPGDLIAVKAMLLDRQPDSVEALGPCDVRCLSHTGAIALAEANAPVAFRFMWQLAEDERRLHNQVAMLGRGNAVERVATMLVDLNGRLTQLGVAETERRQFALCQQDVADYLGLTVVHINRTLGRLREEGAITVQAGTIGITDYKMVRRYAAPMLDIFERNAPEFCGDSGTA